MTPASIVLTVLALIITVLGVLLFVRAVVGITRVVGIGQPTLGRKDHPGRRWRTLLVETFGHTRMLRLSTIGAAHWVVFIGFIYLFFTLVTAYGQLFDPSFALPVIGHFFLYEWGTEVLAWVMVLAIAYLIWNRLVLVGTGRGRFFGSRTWQAVYVEVTILAVGVCILLLRALEAQLPGTGGRFHFPLTFFLLPEGLPMETVESGIVLVAFGKILVSMLWFCVVGLNLTMGVAWHRFTVWPNIWFRRYADGRPALGALQPINLSGHPLDFDKVEDLEESDLERMGAGKIEDFSWKGVLDFTTCTECGRCQSQCPAWATDKPLSPKLLVMGLREHAYAKSAALRSADESAETTRPLVGPNPATVAQAHGAPIQASADGAVGIIDPDVLWSCTSCGACVQECPVDIEHVDHILDMRRHQVLVDSDFPDELNGLYKGLENKGNPWSLNKKGRMDWAKDLPFPVPVVGKDVADLTEVDYLFWVGCAGAFEDRAKKTTQAVAELLHTAGVRFAVLGKAETCTGDPARRSGNEFLFHQLASENAATFTKARATKVVATCAHCLNALANEYPQVGVNLEVIHHTQLLNRLVREGRLTPVAEPAGSVGGRTITYHDPCYLGRHNQVYEAPRALLGSLPGATVQEMPRHGDRSFCCGAGGARMWMEERLGTRINVNRTTEALTTLREASGGEMPQAGAIATGCPFCRVMLTDGLTAEQAEGRGESVEVLDVAQLLLESVRRGQDDTPTPEAPEAPEAPEGR